MKRLSVLLAAALIAGLSACAGGSSTSSSASSAAPASSQAPAAQAPVAATAAADNGATAALPVYPGAVKSTMQLTKSMLACGHKIAMTMYRVSDANADKVGDWYAGQMAGSSEMRSDISAGPSSIHHVMVLNGDGTAGASIVDMPKLPPSMAKYAAKMGGIGGTQLAIATYDPGFSAEDQAMFKAAYTGDAAAKAAAKAQMKAKCGSSFSFGG
jgi:hypothetical protein